MESDTDSTESMPLSRPEDDARRAKQLRDRVLETDPNHGRCLVENCDASRAIEYCHIMARRDWDHRLLNSLEWFWGMRRGALNLDTRRNVVPMGSSVHRIFDTHRWALLPDAAIVQQYSESLDPVVAFATREKFPEIGDRQDFHYRLIPMKNMERITFTRQNEDPETLSADNCTVHVYPFNTLPDLVSHLHPKFVVVATAHAVSKLEEVAKSALLQKFPILVTILKISSAWRDVIPSRAEKDKSYLPPYDPGPRDGSDGGGNGGDDADDEYKGKVTEKGRLDLKRRRAASPTGNRHNTRGAAKRPVQMAIDGDNDIEDEGTEKGRYKPHKKRRGKRHYSAVMTMVEQNRQAGTEGWSKEALINWSKQCDPEPARDVETLVAR